MSSVLIVDSDGASLSGLQRMLRHDFKTRIALGPNLGLQCLMEDGPFGAIIAEYSMPDMDGIEFLSRARSMSPASARILVSRVPMSGDDLIRAINDARVSRFLQAPCTEEELTAVIHEGMDRYQRITASTKGMNEALAIFARSTHEIVCWLRADVRDTISPIVPMLKGLSERTRDKTPVLTETALYLSIIGMINMPEDVMTTLNSGQALTEEQSACFARHPVQTVELLRHLPQLDDAARLLLGYGELLTHRQKADGLSEEDLSIIPFGSLLLAMVMEYRLGMYLNQSENDIFSQLETSPLYDRRLVMELRKQVASMDLTEAPVPLDRLRPGMVVTREVLGEREGKRVVLVPQGYELSRTTIVFLRQVAHQGKVHEPVMVRRSSLNPLSGSGSA